MEQEQLELEPQPDDAAHESTEREAAEAAPAASDELTRERERSEELRRERDDERRRLDEFLARSAPGQHHATMPMPSEREPAPEPMPDPALEPEKFSTWINKQTTATASRVRDEIRQEQSQAERAREARELESEFRARHPQLWPYQTELAEAYAAELRAAGGRVSDRHGFIERVAARVRPEAERHARSLIDPPANRTAGAGGGSTARPRTPKPPPTKPKSLVQQLEAQREKSGLF